MERQTGYLRAALYLIMMGELRGRRTIRQTERDVIGGRGQKGVGEENRCCVFGLPLPGATREAGKSTAALPVPKRRGIARKINGIKQ